jgi:hypothetical protein
VRRRRFRGCEGHSQQLYGGLRPPGPPSQGGTRVVLTRQSTRSRQPPSFYLADQRPDGVVAMDADAGPRLGSVNHGLPSDLSTISFGLLSLLPLKQSTIVTTRPSISVRETRRPPCSQVTSRPAQSTVLPLDCRMATGIPRPLHCIRHIEASDHSGCRQVASRREVRRAFGRSAAFEKHIQPCCPDEHLFEP